MDREGYLRALWQRLSKRMPPEELDGIMRYYADYFDEVGPEGEAQVIAELGNPAELAQRILGERAASGMPVYTPPRRGALKTLALLMLGIFVGIPMGLILLALAAGILAGGVVCLGLGFVCGLSGFALLFGKGLATTMYFLGTGFAAAGIGLLLAGGAVALAVGAVKAAIRCFRGGAGR
jgi:uncharacterized membrane protein